MEKEKEFKVMYSAMEQALSNGMFKSFNDVLIVYNSLQAIGESLASSQGVKAKKVVQPVKGGKPDKANKSDE